jgi:hypothetical protein
MANECKQQGTGNNRGACKEECDDLIIHNPLSKYLNNNNSSPSPIINSTQSLLFDIHQAIHALQTKGYHHIPSIFTNDECHTVMNQLWEFVQDVSGGCVHRTDPMSWYSSEEISLFDCNGNKLQSKCNQEEAETTTTVDDDDMDPWPHTGNTTAATGGGGCGGVDMMQSLGAGYLLGNVREILANRIFEPLFGTDELLCSKEGFTFCRPMIVDLKESNEEDDGVVGAGDADARYLVWDSRRRRRHRQGRQGQVLLSEGQQYGQGVPLRAAAMIQQQQQNNHGGNDNNSNSNNEDDRSDAMGTTTTTTTSKKQHNKQQKKMNKQQRYKDITGLCHIQASISFTDQTIDQHRNGGQ